MRLPATGEMMITYLTRRMAPDSTFDAIPLHLPIVPWFKYDDEMEAQVIMKGVGSWCSSAKLHAGDRTLVWQGRRPHGARQLRPVDDNLQYLHDELIYGFYGVGAEFSHDLHKPVRPVMVDAGREDLAAGTSILVDHVDLIVVRPPDFPARFQLLGTAALKG